MYKQCIYIEHVSFAINLKNLSVVWSKPLEAFYVGFHTSSLVFDCILKTCIK